MRTIIPINRPPYPLHLIEYSDFSCAHCRDLQQLLTTTLPPFGDDVCHTFRHFPDLGNPSSLLMALAAEAARRQDQYQAMHRALFAQTALTPVTLHSVSTLASALGLNLTTFHNDIHDVTLKQRIRTDVEQGRRDGVVATPTLFLGSRRLHGKLTQARLIPLIRYYIDRSYAPTRGTADCDSELVRWSGIGNPPKARRNHGLNPLAGNRRFRQSTELNHHLTSIIMNDQQATVAVYNSHDLVEEAIGKLQKAGYDMTKLSIVGKDYHTDENIVGYYNIGDRMKAWGGRGAFWGGLWGLLFGSAFFIIPGLGPLLIAGPFVASLVAALEGALVVGAGGALGAALVSIGIPKDSILQYETEIRTGRFVLIAHGTAEEVGKAKETLGIRS